MRQNSKEATAIKSNECTERGEYRVLWNHRKGKEPNFREQDRLPGGSNSWAEAWRMRKTPKALKCPCSSVAWSISHMRAFFPKFPRNVVHGIGLCKPIPYPQHCTHSSFPKQKPPHTHPALLGNFKFEIDVFTM